MTSVWYLFAFISERLVRCAWWFKKSNMGRGSFNCPIALSLNTLKQAICQLDYSHFSKCDWNGKTLRNTYSAKEIFITFSSNVVKASEILWKRSLGIQVGNEENRILVSVLVCATCGRVNLERIILMLIFFSELTYFLCCMCMACMVTWKWSHFLSGCWPSVTSETASHQRTRV